jgi:hypothetical protein
MRRGGRMERDKTYTLIKPSITHLSPPIPIIKVAGKLLLAPPKNSGFRV